MKDDRQKRKEAYVDAVAINGIPSAVLQALHSVSDSVIDKYLYVPGRNPTFQACYELFIYLNKRELSIPANLKRVIDACESRVDSVIANHK